MLRRTVLGGLGSGLAAALTGCGGRHAAPPPPASAVAYAPPPPADAPPASAPAPAASGLDAVIDISHMVDVHDFSLVRHYSGILGIIHKATEGGDWVDPSYGMRRSQAEAAGLLWGAYHFGTRQYSGADQAMAFLAAAQPGPSTLIALDYEVSPNPRNTMRLDQAEAFVQTIHRQTGRLPLVYVHPDWANGLPHANQYPSGPITQGSVLARCDLWLGHWRDVPEVPMAWANRGWRFWQYVADERPDDAAYGSEPRTVQGVSHCDRNLFAGDAPALYRYWNGSGGSAPRRPPRPGSDKIAQRISP